jgi:hypothetical protein
MTGPNRSGLRAHGWIPASSWTPLWPDGKLEALSTELLQLPNQPVETHCHQ